jgi:cardiolipin synthase A/B
MHWSLVWIGYLLTWTIIPHILTRNKPPASTLAWVWAVILFPYGGALFYFAFGTDRLVRQKLRATRQMDAAGGRGERRVNADTASLLKDLPDPDRVAIELLSDINEYAVSCADEARLLVDGAEFFDALMERIDQAEDHVHIEFYIWRKDARGNAVLERLIAAAERGVQVRLLLDPIGCFGLRRSSFSRLIEAGGKFAWFRTSHPFRNQWTFTLRNHRKLQIIDGRRCFVGGMNMGREYAGEDPSVGPWRDCQVEICGAATRKFQMIFADDWFFASQEKLLASRYYPVPSCTQNLIVQSITDGPDDPDDPIQMSLVWMLNNARRRVWLTAGYFGPSEPLLTAIQLAAARGVDVRMIVAGKSDHPMLVNIGRSYYEELLRYNVKIYEYESGINHAKVALLDDEWLMVGSANLDVRSMRLNFELNALIRDKATAARLERVLSKDLAESREIVEQEFAKRSRWQRWKESMVRPFGPLA